MATDLGVMNEVICTCGRCVFEADVTFCSGCGDVMCKDCYTDCFTCGKMYCINCSQSPVRCLKCDTKRAMPKIDEKAFLVLDGKVNVATAIKNSAFMIQKTGITNARDITLDLGGNKYRFCYRQMVLNEQDKFDYFLYFEEIKETTLTEEQIEQVRKAFDSYLDEEFEKYESDYEDYGNPWVGW